MWSLVGSLVFVSIFATPSILAHAANLHPEAKVFRATLYSIYAIYLLFFCGTSLISVFNYPDPFLCFMITGGFALTIFLCMFRPVRRLLPYILGPVNSLVTLNFIINPLCKKFAAKAAAGAASANEEAPPKTFHDASMLKQIFLPDSAAHLNGLILFLFSLAFSLQRVSPTGFNSPSLDRVPHFRGFDIGLGVDFVTTLLVVAIGVGIMIVRKPREVLFRLSLVKPGWKEFALGITLCFATFGYDYIWSLYTHSSAAGAHASVMRDFNLGSYMESGSLQSALIMATVAGVVAGFEEEITNRGALQPVLGIVPAAILHAALHSQFNAAPLFMVQIFGWSAMMGIAKYYSNTTTTIIAHGLFNFLSCFLIGFNP